jgi:hypothetical protein
MCADELRKPEQDLAAFDAKIKQPRRQAALNLKPPVFTRAPLAPEFADAMVRSSRPWPDFKPQTRDGEMVRVYAVAFRGICAARHRSVGRGGFSCIGDRRVA